MRFSRLSKSHKSRRRDTNRRNFLKVEQLEHRMVLTGVAPIAINDLYDAVMDEPLEVASPGILANDSGALAITGGIVAGVHASMCAFTGATSRNHIVCARTKQSAPASAQ